MKPIDVDHLKSIAAYDPCTGIVTWREREASTFRNAGPYADSHSRRWNAKKAGKPVGAIGNLGYIVACIEKRTVMVHRMAWAIYYGDYPSGQIDHINGIKHDNRLINLRDVTASENSQNRKRPRTNMSGFMGVHFHKPGQKWHARIMKDGVRHHLGAFDDPEGASKAYEYAKSKFCFHQNHGR